MSPIWSSTAPLKSVSKGVWRAGEMRTCGRLLHMKPAAPTAARYATRTPHPGCSRVLLNLSFATLQSKVGAD